MSNLLYIQLVICLIVQVVLAQQASRQPELDRALINLLSQDNNSGNRQELDSVSSPERVDKLASAAGDVFWRLQPKQQHLQQPQDWIYQQAAPSFRYQRSLPEPIDAESANNEANYQRFLGPLSSDSYLSAAPQSASLIGLDGPGGGSNTRNYHALMDEFKQYSRLANPSRESRAFKPKLMSTARGFGKRSQNFKSHSDLFATNSHSKPTGNEQR